MSAPRAAPSPGTPGAFLALDFARQGQFAPPPSPARLDIHNEANHSGYFRGRPDVFQLL